MEKEIRKNGITCKLDEENAKSGTQEDKRGRDVSETLVISW